MILVVMAVVFLAPRPGRPRLLRAQGARRGAPHGALAVSRGGVRRPARPPPGDARPPGPAARPRRAAGRRRGARSTTGARLGWAIESNWTDPFLFAIYSVARPVGAALVLVAIVWLVARRRPPGLRRLPHRRQRLLDLRRRRDVRASSGPSSTTASATGCSSTSSSARSAFLPFLVGRASAQLVAAAAGFLVTLLVGVVFLGVQIDLAAIDWRALRPVDGGRAGRDRGARPRPWPASASRSGARRGATRRRSPAGLYLLSGAIFPPDVLPAVAPAGRPRAAHHLVAGGGPPGAPGASRRPRSAGRLLRRDGPHRLVRLHRRAYTRQAGRSSARSSASRASGA